MNDSHLWNKRGPEDQGLTSLIQTLSTKRAHLEPRRSKRRAVGVGLAAICLIPVAFWMLPLERPSLGVPPKKAVERQIPIVDESPQLQPRGDDDALPSTAVAHKLAKPHTASPTPPSRRLGEEVQVSAQEPATR